MGKDSAFQNFGITLDAVNVLYFDVYMQSPKSRFNLQVGGMLRVRLDRYNVVVILFPRA